MSMPPASAATWEKLPPLPEENGGFISGSLDGKVFLAGGTTWREGKKYWLETIHTFAPQAKTWQQVGRLPQPLAYAAAGVYGGMLHFAGGSSGEKTWASLFRIAPQGQVHEATELKAARVYSSSAVLSGRLYMVGGARDAADLGQLTAGGLSINLFDGTTQPLPDLPLRGLMVGAAAAAGGKLYFFGGAHWDAAQSTAENIAKAFVYTPGAERWEPLPDLPSPNRGLCGLTLSEDAILLAGGYKNDQEEFTDETFLFHPSKGTYTPAPRLPYRAMVSLVLADGYVYCIGGEDRKQHRTDAFYRLPVAEFLR